MANTPVPPSKGEPHASPTPVSGPKPTPPASPYPPYHKIAAAVLVAALLIIFGTAFWPKVFKTAPSWTGGDAAAAFGVLLVLALVLEMPALIMDDKPENGGEPSTMRIAALAIVLTFCAIMLKTAWNSTPPSLPSLAGQGNWVWLVTAAIGGKAAQSYIESRDKSKNGGASSGQ